MTCNRVDPAGEITAATVTTASPHLQGIYFVVGLGRAGVVEAAAAISVTYCSYVFLQQRHAGAVGAEATTAAAARAAMLLAMFIYYSMPAMFVSSFFVAVPFYSFRTTASHV